MVFFEFFEFWSGSHGLSLEFFFVKLCAYFYFGQLMLYLVLWLRIHEKN